MKDIALKRGIGIEKSNNYTLFEDAGEVEK